MKKKKVGISCRNKAIYIIKRNNIKMSQRFLLLNCLYSFGTESELNVMKEHKKIKIFVKFKCHQKKILY